jgi:transcriptional regulator with XRE-family HTH domain
VSRKKLVTLRARRVSAGYSINELARRSTMAYSAIEREEHSVAHQQSGGGLFDDRHAAQIAAALGTTAADLRGEQA